MLVTDSAILDAVVFDIVREHLLMLDTSNLVLDLKRFNLRAARSSGALGASLLRCITTWRTSERVGHSARDTQSRQDGALTFSLRQSPRMTLRQSQS